MFYQNKTNCNCHSAA